MFTGLRSIESVDDDYRLVSRVESPAEKSLRIVNVHDHSALVFPGGRVAQLGYRKLNVYFNQLYGQFNKRRVTSWKNAINGNSRRLY